MTDHTTEATDGAAELSDAAQQTLRLAGYDLRDAEQRRLGRLAYQAAVLMHRGALEAARGGRFGRVGRNDPCPCGSGKKYKKCCLAEGKAQARASLDATPGDEPLDPALVPRLHDGEQTGADLRQLGALLERDPDLRTLRLPGPSVARFLAAAGKDGPELEGTELDRFVDRVAQRYMQVEPEGAALFVRLTEQLGRAAARQRSTDQLRSLALGSLYAALERDRAGDEGHGPSPLVCAIFRLSLGDELRRRSDGERTRRGSGKKAGPQAKLSPELAAELRQSGENLLEELGRAIRQGRCPVLLPNPSLLPLFARIEQRQHAGQPPSRDQVAALVARAVAEWLPEDRRLLGAELERWVERNPNAAAEALGQVRSLQALVAGECVEPLDVDLALAALRQSRGSPLEGEPRPAAGAEEATFTADYLERYGDFLASKGYPALARRTYALCGEHGPLPPSVAEKLARLGRG